MKNLLLIIILLAFGLTNYGQAVFTWQGGYVGDPDDWNTADNWDTGIVPGAGNHVIIPDIGVPGTAHYPVIFNGETAVCNNLTINAGTNLSYLLVEGELTYYGDVEVHGNLYVVGTITLHSTPAPTSLVVYSNEDDGAGSLRDAIFLIADGGDITFYLTAGNEQITLASPLTIDKSLIIDGANTAASGNSVTVTGDGTHRIFHITTAADGKTIEFGNMKINEGVGTAPGGGGILCEAGTLNVDNVYFTHNHATGTGATDGGGAIHATNTTCNISNSTFDDNYSAKDGGGMYVSDDINCNITNSTFNGNTSDNDGGGMLVKGSNVTITGCTFSDNQAGAAGGGINGGGAGGLVIIINSTFSGNQANGGGGGAIHSLVENVNMNFTTVSGNTATTNGGGVYLSTISNLAIQNSMLGNNTAATGSDFSVDGTSTVTDNGYNIVENSDGYDFTGNNNITGDQANLFGTGLTTQTLDDNGGPTQTLEIEPGSVAIRAGVADATVPDDQRGDSREDPPTIGAFENPDVAVGDFYAGGVVFWLDGNGGGLICAISDQSGGKQWYDGTNMVTGATATDIGTGQANTTTIIGVQGPGDYAAIICDDYDDGTYDDWFLPSQDELHEIFLNKAAIDVTAIANGGDALGNYAYWSSTEFDIDEAYWRDMETGVQGKWQKNSTYAVRAVRAF